MTKEKFVLFCLEAGKIRNDEKVKEAIQKQEELSKIVYEKEKKRYAIEDKLFELYHSISTDGITDGILGSDKLSVRDQLSELADLWINDSPKVKKIIEVLEKSGKSEEISKLEKERENALFDYFDSLLKLDTAINESREHLFSKDYKAKLKEYADNGVFLFFMETPDFPIICKDISIQDVLESFVINDFESIYILFQHFITLDNPTPSMKMKIEDIVSSIECLKAGKYRAASRNLFALLESEHKNCSSAMDNYFTLSKKASKGKERANKIQQLLEGLKSQTYFINVWNLVNPIYRDILSSEKNSFIDRNSIIHGDYYSDKLNINEYDVIKLMLLYLNMRMISDHIQLYCEMLRESINYTVIFFAQKTKESIKQNNKV